MSYKLEQLTCEDREKLVQHSQLPRPTANALEVGACKKF